MKEIMKKAFTEGKLYIIIDNRDQSISINYFVGDGTDQQTEKYQIITPDIQESMKAIQYAVGYCVDRGKVIAYLENIGILKGIFNFYTDMPKDMFTDDEIDIIINKCMLSYDSYDMEECNIGLRRYYEAVCTELEDVRKRSYYFGNIQRIFEGTFDNFSLDNEEVKTYLIETLKDIAALNNINE